MIEEMNHVNLAQVVKYVWRADSEIPKDNPMEDLEKAFWFLGREIERRKKRAQPFGSGEWHHVGWVYGDDDGS